MATNDSPDPQERIRALEDELRQVREELRHARKTEVLGRLAGAVAHDFNNLITAICGFSDILIENLPPGDPLLDDAREIEKAGRLGTALTRQLLSFSRRRPVQPARLSLNSIVGDAERLLRRLMGDSVELVVSRSEEPVFVRADAGQLEQVLMNLVVNARDAMPDGGTLTIETAAADAGDGSPCARLTVRDTGSGIPPEILDRIFEPFFSTKGEQGTGLGLATVQAIVKECGGFLQVASEPGRGAAFEVWLPRVEAAAEEQAPAQAPARPLGGTETVLVVEDDELVRELACRVLEVHGYAAIETRTPEDALRWCASSRRPVDVVVSDIVMPRLSGLDLAERVRRSSPSTRFLFVSGYGGDHPLVEKAAADGTAFLQKPFSGEVLLERIRKLLDAPA